MAPPESETRLTQELRLSHQRCRTRADLHETTSHPVIRLQEAELADRRDRFLDRIGGFAPELDRGALLPDKHRFSLLVADAEGFVVEAYAPDGCSNDFQRCGIGAGALWDERVAGTNGIDMALRTGRIVSVVGRDHFHHCFRDFACTSAPLRDAQGDVIGSVTLVGAASRRREEIAWSEQILRIVSARFQTRLFRNFHTDRITARLFSADDGPAGHFESIAACDSRGYVVAHLPLSTAHAAPVEHRNLVGRHLADLRDLTITVRGAACKPPPRTIARGARIDAPAPPRKFPGTALARLAAQGGGMDLIVERARKLLSRRVPLLLCGEQATGKADLAARLIEDLRLVSPMDVRLDCARMPPQDEFDTTLAHMRLLCEHAIAGVRPSLVLMNVNRLGERERAQLEAIIHLLEPSSGSGVGAAPRPTVIFTADRCWRALAADPALGDTLLYLMGQAVLDLPPLRERDLALVLDDLIADEFPDAVEISVPAREALLAHDWPGNLREMRAVIREALICGNGRVIHLPDLPQRLLAGAPATVRADRMTSLREALDSTGWNVTRAARLLGKSRATVNRWLAEQGLRRPE